MTTMSFEVYSSNTTVSSRLNLLKSTCGRLGIILASSGVTFLDRSDSDSQV